MARYYTGVGSRQTPIHILKLMEQIASAMASKGYIGRSGGAVGADAAFERGAVKSGGKFDAYIPWGAGFIRKGGILSNINPSRYDNYTRAIEMAAGVHPAWERCSDAAKKLHTRNVYQILGNDLESPSEVCFLYAEPCGKTSASRRVRGGTNTAFQLALKYNVPVYNLYFQNDRQRVCKKLGITYDE